MAENNGTPQNVHFESKLGTEIHEPWSEYYLNYIHLKKLLKEEVIIKNAWTDKDEENFVSALDSDLEKVYTFQMNTYDELNEQLNELQRATESPSAEFDVQKFTAQLEHVMEQAQELNRFQRLNFTGFTKIVKKHDRLHPAYSVKPLLNVRLKSLPFHSEDYSPLLFKISALYQFLRDNYDVDQTLSKMSSFNEESVEDYQSFKFWVHPDNLMEVKTTILRHLPVLVYNTQNTPYADYDDDDDDDDEDEVARFAKNDPTITCLYFDSENFDLYNNKLTKAPNASTLRLKWVGPLHEKPEISLEKKTFEKQSETFDVDEKFTLKEKYLDSFVSGRFNAAKYLGKLQRKGKSPEEIETAKKHIDSFSKYIADNHVQPCLRTQYKRTAFQIPGDDKVRVVIDSDIYFIREDAFDAQRPIRDPSKWHRTDIDSKVNNPMSLLRKGEFVKFPYAELEVKIRTKRRGSKIVWIDELLQSHLVKEIPHFSKFIHGIGSLFLEDDKLDTIPFWFNELEADLTFDPERAFLDTREKMAKLQSDEDNLAKFKSMVANSASPNLAPRSKSFSGSEMMGDIQRKTSHSGLDPVAEIETEAEGENEQNGQNGATSGADLDASSDDDYEDDIGTSLKNRILNLPSTFSKLLDADSEDEEVDLPLGVAKPERYIKNAGPLKIEPKVWMANERTFNRWLHVTTLLSTLTFVVYSSTAKANSPALAEHLAYGYFALTLFSGVWGYYIFLRRRTIITERSDRHLDSVAGPLVVAAGLMAALVINFVSGFRRLAAERDGASAGVFTAAGLTADFYARNPAQRAVLETVFRVVGA